MSFLAFAERLTLWRTYKILYNISDVKPVAVHVLHCFKKKTEKTAFTDLSLARQRYRAAIKQEHEP